MYKMNTSVLFWLVLAVVCICTCLTGAVPRGGEYHHSTGWSFNRVKRDVRITNSSSPFPTARPRHTFRRWTTRPAGQPWVPLTGTVNNNLTEKEISSRQNKTKWNRYPTVNRFYSTPPYITDSPVIQNDSKLASNHHYNSSLVSTTNDSSQLVFTLVSTDWGHVTAEPVSPTGVEQSSRLSLEERYTIVIIVISALLLLALVGFLAHCNRVRKRRKVISITLA